MSTSQETPSTSKSAPVKRKADATVTTNLPRKVPTISTARMRMKTPPRITPLLLMNDKDLNSPELSSCEDEEDDEDEDYEEETEEGTEDEDSESNSSTVLDDLEICVPKKFDPDFLIKTWGIATKVDAIKTFKDQLQGMGAQVIKEFLEYLSGEKKFESVEELLKFSNQFPEEFDGKFVLAVLIVDYCFTASIEDLKILAVTKSTKDPQLADVLAKICLFQIQKHVRWNLESSSNFQDELWNKINFDFCGLDHPGEARVLTIYEHDCLSDVSQIIMNMSLLTSPTIDPDLISKRTTLAFSSIKWSLHSNGDGVSTLSHILEHDLKHKKNVSLFFYLQSKGAVNKEGVYLHDAVVEMYGDGKPQEEITLTGTLEDKATLITLLYYPESYYEVTDYLTFAVYEMAVQLGIQDVWRFMFHNQSPQRILKIRIDITNLVQIATAARKQDTVKKLKIKHFAKPEMFSIFKMMKPDDLVWLRNVTDFDLKAYDWYQLLLFWAHEQAGASMNLADIKYDTIVNNQFKRVKFLIDVRDMKQLWNSMIPHRYMFQEILKAKGETTA